LSYPVTSSKKFALVDDFLHVGRPGCRFLLSGDPGRTDFTNVYLFIVPENTKPRFPSVAGNGVFESVDAISNPLALLG
jgi:hypothetical protein